MPKKKKTHETPTTGPKILTVRGNAYAEIPVPKVTRKEIVKAMIEQDIVGQSRFWTAEDRRLALATGTRRLSRLRNTAWKLQHGR